MMINVNKKQVNLFVKYSYANIIYNNFDFLKHRLNKRINDKKKFYNIINNIIFLDYYMKQNDLR